MRNTQKIELAIETETAAPTIGILSYLPFYGKQVFMHPAWELCCTPCYGNASIRWVFSRRANPCHGQRLCKTTEACGGARRKSST